MFLLVLKIYEIFQVFVFILLKWVNFFIKKLDPAVKLRDDRSARNAESTRNDKSTQDDKKTRFLKLRDPKNFLASVKEAHEKFAQIKSQNKDAQIFWFHIASSGELEQAIPIARCFHEQLNAFIFLTYYSPSTEPFIKNFPGLLMATGLPLDNVRTYQKAYAKLPFSKIFFVRYDLWPALVHFASTQQIELNLLCATQQKTKTGLIANLGQKFHLFLLKKFKHIFVVTENDVQYFQRKLPEQNIVFAGDSKWWRAKERAEKFKALSLDSVVRPKNDTFIQVFKFIKTHIKENHLKCVVFGSPHNVEHEIALQCVSLKTHLLIVYVPHEVSESKCAKLAQEFQDKGGTPCLYSEISNSEHISAGKFNVIIVDEIGHLAELYALGDLAVVGGGFDGQIHNILEPCAHGVPTLIGPNFSRAPEAQTLVENQAVLAFKTPNLLFQFFVHWVTIEAIMEQLHIVHEHAIKLFKSIPNTNQNILKTFLHENLQENLQENKL